MTTLFPKVDKFVVEEISIFYHTFLTRVHQGTFSDIHKSGDTSLANNCRRITTLSVFSKVYERGTASRLTSYFEKRNNVLDATQFVFRKNSSTELTVLQALNILQNN